jgi:RimJ/RimL family protein N-acetyltransferase
MNRRPGAPVVYELRVAGHLDDRWAAWFEGMTLARLPDGSTVLRGPVADQAVLHGILTRVRDLGASLTSVTVTDGAERRDNPLDRIAWPVRTERLVLRPATPDDVGTTWRYRRLASVTEWLPRAPASIEEYRALYLEPMRLDTTVLICLDDEVIGDLMIKVEDGWAQAEVIEQGRGTQAELGWVLHPYHGGRGYATEAVREAVRICFEELEVRRITAHCFAANSPSWRLAERLGMRREAYTVQEALHRSGGWMDGMHYALLAEEWSRR